MSLRLYFYENKGIKAQSSLSYFIIETLVKASIYAIKESKLGIQTFLKICKPWLVIFSSGEGTFTGNLQVIFLILMVIIY